MTQQQRRKIVLVVGVFDLFHRGHVELLRRARALGERLIVVINGDEFTAAYKRRPVYSEEDRAAIVAATRFADNVVVSNSSDVKPHVERFGINVIVHGDDWEHESYLRQIDLTEQYILDRGIELVYTPYYAGVSTSALIKRLRELD
jgi:glycerol-3-phosphate cytidylyltransferase